MNSSFKSFSLLAFFLFLLNLGDLALAETVNEDTSLSISMPNFVRFQTDGKTSHGSISTPDPLTNSSTYVPDGNFSGNDAFTWISFSGGSEQENNVSIIVSEVDDPPVFTSFGGASSTSLSVKENQKYVSDLNGTDAENSALSYSIDSTSVDSSFFDINSTSGNLWFKYAPNYERPLDAGANNTYEVVVVVYEDGNSNNKDTLTLTVIVTNDSDPPEITGRSEVTVFMDEDGSPTSWRDPDLNASDPDGGNLTWSILSNASRGNATFTSASNPPIFTYSPNLDFNGTDTFTLKVTDPTGLSDEIIVTVEVANINDAPSFSTPNTVSVSENQVSVMDVNVSDADLEDIHTYSLSKSEFDGAFFDINATTGFLAFMTPPNFESNSSGNGNNLFTVKVLVTDNTVEAIPVEKLIQVTVLDANDAPIFKSHDGNSSVSLMVPENQLFIVDVNVTDEDGDALTYSLGGSEKDFFEINATGSLSFITPTDYESNASVSRKHIFNLEVNATDGMAVASQIFSIQITNLNDTSPLYPSRDTNGSLLVKVAENGVFVVELNATDLDGATPDYVVSGGGDEALFEVNGTGALSFKVAPDFEIPASKFGGNEYFLEVNATDGLYTVIESVIVQVVDVDEVAPIFPPSWGLLYSTSVQEGNSTHVLDLNASDNNVSVLFYSLVPGKLDNAFFVIDQNVTPPRLEFAESPDFERSRSNVYDLEINASDGLNSSLQLLKAAVSNVNEPPYFIESDFTVNEDSEVQVLKAVDPEGQSVSFSILSPPAYGTLVSGVGSLFYRPNANFYGQDSFALRISDGLLESNRSIVLSVLSLNDKPKAVDDIIVFSGKQASYSLDVTVNDGPNPDPDENFTLSISSNPKFGVVSIQGDKVLYTPSASGFYGEDSFTYVIRDRPTSDSQGLSDSAKVSLMITPLGWNHSNGFGYFYQVGQSWVYHEKLGWTYVSSSILEKQNIWMWNEDLGWFWSGNAFPYGYINDLKSWCYLSLSKPSAPWYYSYASRKWLDADSSSSERLSSLLHSSTSIAEALSVLRGFDGVSETQLSLISTELSLFGESNELIKLGIKVKFAR
ncbi:MAG: hypothetical protein CMI26_00675 [Opitutae bacterium]|nr:hypothetical protein [Opitutae bacterium]